MGGESTGKSTLAEALAAALPGQPVWEYLRVWVDTHGRIPAKHEQEEILRGQIAAEDEALRVAAATGVPWVISDSGVLMTAVYSSMYFDDDHLVAPALEASRRYRLTVWCGDDVPWQADPQRDGPAAREQAQHLIGEVLSGCDLLWIRASGGLEERVAMVLAALDGPPAASSV